MKVFRFEERVKTIVTNYYEIFAETEEEALALAQAGYGFQESFTHDPSAPGEFEMYDSEEIPDTNRHYPYL